MKYSVYCDFDGTISIGDIGNRLFRTFATGNIDGILNEWKEGKIGSRECLRRECELVSATKEELLTFSDEQKIEPSFKKFYDYCKRRNWNFLIVSDGLDFYIHRILKNYNLNNIPVYANHVKFVSKNKIDSEYPYYDKGCLTCGNCKGYFVKEEQKKGNKVIFIGNGYSDRCAVPAADIVFAKTDLKKYCELNNYSYFDFNDFNDIIDKLESMKLEKKEERRTE